MGQDAPVIFRYPLLALAAADLVFLALRLWPWSAIGSLPGPGTGSDPLICLAAYIGLMYWLTGNENIVVRQALSLGMEFGLPAGMLLAAHVLITPRPGWPSLVLHMAFLVGAGALWSAAGFRAARAADHFGIGIVSGAWSGMVSALLACSATLARIDMRALPPQAPESWTQQATLAFNPPAVHSLVHGLVMTTGFLLICPLIGGALGMVCGLAQDQN